MLQRWLESPCILWLHTKQVVLEALAPERQPGQDIWTESRA